VPKLFIIAGAPGSGKSRTFPVSEFGVDFFNADDRAAQLNGDSYHNIPLDVRSIVNREFEAFIEEHIANGVSFALETTLRSQITFDQILSAKRNGFQVSMRYLGIADPATNLKRIKVRSKRGFHAAPIDVLMAIHSKSLENLRTASELAYNGNMSLLLYDNSAHNRMPELVC
jgi:predicted ABC-type ATPase